MTRQQLLESIRPGMRLDKAFFLSIYADEITWPGSADEAIRKLEEAGCSKAREYYNKTVAEYQEKRERELRPIARQIRRQWEAEWREQTRMGAGGNSRWIRSDRKISESVGAK